jgi:hypothetical protein
MCGPSVVLWEVFLFCVVITLVLKELSFFMIGLFVILMKGSPVAAIKLLPCDHEVMC